MKAHFHGGPVDGDEEEVKHVTDVIVVRQVGPYRFGLANRVVQHRYRFSHQDVKGLHYNFEWRKFRTRR